MKASEVHALGDQDLVQAIRDAREDAFNLRFRHATGELENSAGRRGHRDRTCGGPEEEGGAAQEEGG